jgi:succinate-acetate transporter protein
MNEPSLTQIKDTTANPAPLGLLGFGMTTVFSTCTTPAALNSTA